MATKHVTNETRNSGSRMTKDNRKLTYTLNVIQQPERARACGSGAKSSADRRPVDPPPIVELHVFDGDQDITFGYPAQFFLYATLEHSRVIAQARGTSTANTFPVLTGTPVAGVAYLDRPTPAGYFIFPDLSVRHEGNYRLSFSLYEQHKHPLDADPENINDPNALGENEPHVSFRLEVKSQPFIVYSAKKFPGLKESTSLSRMVAEQGCRVRIRRDVRMRRRENKADKEWDTYEDETAFERARRTATPGSFDQGSQPPIDGGDRPRSVSNASVASYAVPSGRRPSLEQQYQQQPFSSPAMPHPPQQPYSQYPSQPQYSAPYAPPPAPMQQQQNLMQPPQMSWPNQQSNYMGGSYSQMPPPAHQYGSYEQQVHNRNANMEYSQNQPDYRRPTMQHQQQHQQHQQQQYVQNHMMNSYANSTNNNMDSYRHHSVGQSAQQVPPMQPIQPRSTTPVPSSAGSNGMSGQALAPLRTQLTADKNEQASSPAYATPASGGPIAADPLSSSRYYQPTNSYQAQRAGPVKRSYGDTFGEQPEESLRQGARPSTTPARTSFAIAADVVADDDDGYEQPMEKSAMSYRRADGTERRRAVPAI